MVRFVTRNLATRLQNPNQGWETEWKIGLLVEYHTWEKVATILHNGKILRIHADRVQKAGKKDLENIE